MKNSFKLFILAHKNNRGIHKKVVYTVIMILLFLLLIIPFSIFKTYDNELKRFEKENDSSKIVSFFYSEKEKYEKIKNKVEESKYFIKEKDYTIPFKSGSFEEISGIYDDDTYINPYIYEKDITFGKNLKNANEIICSNLLNVDFDNKDSNKLVNMKNYIGKTLNFNTRKIVYDENIEDYKNILYTYEFKVVGTYDDIMYNSCYIKENIYDNIASETFPALPMEGETALYFDSINGAQTASKIFDKNNIFYTLPSYDTTFIVTIRVISYILGIVFFILLLLMFNVYIKVFIKEKEKTLILYNYLGYTKKDLNKVILFSFYEIVSTSLIITLLICLIIKICLNYFLNLSVEYHFLNISIYILPVFIMLFILIILSTFIVNNENKKLYKRMKL